MENILITGITGQDGIFLTKNLLEQNQDCVIHGTSRNKDISSFQKNLSSLGVTNFDNIKIYNLNLEEKQKVENLITSVSPDIVFNLAGPSSVYESFSNPKKTIDLITNIFNNLTGALISQNIFCNFFQASSSEMFNSKVNEIINEDSPIKSNSPYAEAKIINHNKAKNLIKTYDWNITSGIMFNHESEFRDAGYLTSKIIKNVYEIYNKREQKIVVGSLDYVRDWSFAGDIMNGALLLSLNDARGSYIMGSGIGTSIKELIQIVFNYFDLNWEKYTDVDESLLRKGDPKIKISDPTKISNEFGWKTELSFEDLIIRCIEKKININ
ncbi:GDP-mannose 4,6-dehydratase [Acidimicrobiaceae bacterium]|nr:GDP-mannose 4,6-dehydratase [Acidimicrobiaceae bacterium]